MNRKSWMENAALLVGSVALLVWFLVQSTEHPSARDTPQQPAMMVLLVVSAFFSARVVVDLASRYQPAVGWWLRGMLRWSFEWMLHALVTLIAIGITVSVLPVISGWTAVILTAAIATLLLIRQILRDYRAARHRFGSLARAEKALHSNRSKRA